MDPHPYQAEAVDRAFAAWRSGLRSTLFICPTGGGKSFVFSLTIKRHIAEGGRRALIIADREWLVQQARDNIKLHTGLSVGIEMAEDRVSRATPPQVVCASAQSLVKRLRYFPADAFDLIVFDEADLALAPSYRKVAAHFAGARIFGVTATPERADGISMGEMFESVCLDVDIRDLIDAGYLANVRQWPIKTLDLSRIKNPDDNPVLLDKILREESHLHEVVKPTMELAETRPTLVFGVSVKHATDLAQVFNRYREGSARVVYGKTSRVERRSVIQDFVARKFQFLCNCNLIMRGVDIPSIECVAMARPTMSRTIYVQGLGRGLRTSEKTGKKDCLVLDFTDGADTHSLVSAVDVLGGKASPEARERAREIVEEEPGKDVSDALDQAQQEVDQDAELRARVRASVRFKKREMSLREPIDWKALPLGKVPDREIAEKLGLTAATVECARHRLGIKMEKVDDGKAA